MNTVKKENRMESIRFFVQELISSMNNEVEKQEASIHLFGVSSLASLLAMRRGQDSELASIAGLLHRFYEYKTGICEFSGLNSAESVRPFIRDLDLFTNEEQNTILRAIFYHEDRSSIQGPFEEILKDAYVLQLYLHKPDIYFDQDGKSRLEYVLKELMITSKSIREEKSKNREWMHDRLDTRELLAEIAETLAREDIIGVPGDERYREICRYWPDSAIYKVLKNSWCAAFVYHCCRLAGLHLPIRYPNGVCRFAGVAAWLEWAQLPETGFLHKDGHDGFTPQRGDIVIYDKLLSDDPHDHIGIILSCEDTQVLVAEGNRDNQNYSDVFYRERHRFILGYIRINDGYQYEWNGEYIPIT
ncbi:CHAP domain-containing protein [Bacillus sp. FJAT-28004]|uniref:CHAP domain-containing protein n=1 Tax=Bacillus sp. FJAT-28004 TaxID=1679165 RepID=UPI0006B5780A|nr:CHAP domain-containing protein [Bacillus sp. FJAT-28004]